MTDCAFEADVGRAGFYQLNTDRNDEYLLFDSLLILHLSQTANILFVYLGWDYSILYQLYVQSSMSSHHQSLRLVTMLSSNLHKDVIKQQMLVCGRRDQTAREHRVHDISVIYSWHLIVLLP